MTINLKNLAEIRHDNDISQEKMAKILRVKRSALSKWELGVTLPSLKNIFYFAKYFEFSIDYVLGLNHDHRSVKYTDYDMKLIAHNLRTLRLNAGLTLYDLAKKLEISHSSIVHYERAKSNPSLNIFYKYTKLFKISFHDLVTTKL